MSKVTVSRVTFGVEREGMQMGRLGWNMGECTAGRWSVGILCVLVRVVWCG